MKRISIGLLALAQTTPLADVFNRVKDSVVMVRTIQKKDLPWGGPERLSVPGPGSGVLISPEHVLTAAHVI